MEFTYKRAYYSDTGTGTGREKIYTHNNGSGRSLRQRSRFRIRRSQNRSSSGGGSRKCYEILMCFRSTLSWWVFLKHSCALRWTLLSERSKPTVAHTQQTHRNERISFSTLIHRVIRCFDRWWVFGVFFFKLFFVDCSRTNTQMHEFPIDVRQPSQMNTLDWDAFSKKRTIEMWIKFHFFFLDREIV